MKQSNITIGLIGGSGSGKSVVSSAGISLGFTHIDGDKIGHEIILRGKPAYKKLVEAFSKEILSENGEINRKKLGEIAFSDKENLKILNEITHGEIIREIEAKIHGNTIVDAAVLHTTPFIEKCDYVIFVSAPEKERIKRITARDGITYDNALKRIKSQPGYDEYAKFADFILENNGEEEECLKEAVKLINSIKSKSERTVNA